MTEVIGMYLIFVAIIWFCVLVCGIDLDLKDKLVIGFGSMALILLVEIGVYLLNRGLLI